MRLTTAASAFGHAAPVTRPGRTSAGFVDKLDYVWRVDDDAVKAPLTVAKAAERLSY
jgi:hypothetical protein